VIFPNPRLRIWGAKILQACLMKSSETLRHQMTQSVLLTKLGNSRTPSFEKPFLAFLYPAQARRDLLQLVFRASRGVFDDQHLAGRHVAHGEQPESRHAREVGKLLICLSLHTLWMVSSFFSRSLCTPRVVTLGSQQWLNNLAAFP
jgi:hypothetical protein